MNNLSLAKLGCYWTIMCSCKLKLSCKQQSNRLPGGNKRVKRGRGNSGLQVYMWHHFNHAIWKTKTAPCFFFAHICKGNTSPQVKQQTDTVQPTFSFPTSFPSSFSTRTCMCDSLCDNSRRHADITEECGQSKTKVCAVHTRREFATGMLDKRCACLS